MTHGHVITIIAKAFNVDFAPVDHVAPCTYFTKQALVRGEVVDASFHVVPTHTRSCWKGIPHPHFSGAHDEEDHAQVGIIGDIAQGTERNVGDDDWPQDDVPLPSFPTHGGASGSSSHDLPIWEQVLAKQRAMQQQLNGMETFTL